MVKIIGIKNLYLNNLTSKNRNFKFIKFFLTLNGIKKNLIIIRLNSIVKNNEYFAAKFRYIEEKDK